MRKNGMLQEWNDGGTGQDWSRKAAKFAKKDRSLRSSRLCEKICFDFERKASAVFLPVISALVILTAAGCGRGKPDETAAVKKPMPMVQVARAQQRDLIKKMTYTGSVEPVKLARMASPAEGPVVACSVREGDFVKQGQILVSVGRSRIAETGLEAAREELRRQEAEFKRVEQLVKSGSLAGEQVDVARSNLKRAEAQVAAMETSAGDYEVEAPWDGVVSRVWISEGNYVSPRAQLVELYDPASLIVRLSVPEQQALSVHAGQKVDVSLDAYPDRRFTGTLSRVYPELERVTRTLTTEISLNEEVRLLSGMFARVDMAIQTVTNAVVVPERALLVLPTGESVAYVLEGEKAVRRSVKTSLEAGGMVAVETGIAAGESVIVSGNDSLKDGAAVQVMGQKKKEAGASGEAKPGPSGPADKTGKGKPAS